MFCGGEILPAALRNNFFERSSAELVNLYGPTETTIDTTFHVLDRADKRPFVPIGRPIANVSVRVLDQSSNLLPAGAIGELYIGGDAVGVGYVNRPGLTAERFLQSVTGSAERLYRTGDRVRLLSTGELQFLGRRDNQIKLRGFRIELGEIESLLTSHPAVHEAAAVTQEFQPGDQRLVAFVAPSRPESLDLRLELHAWLSERLPRHAVPATILIERTLPKTSHGKIDRLALAQKAVVPTSTAPAEHSNAFEKTLCRVFEEILHVRPVGLDDDFFHLGGHSLLVVSLQEKLLERTGMEINVVDVFEHPTPRALAKRLNSSTVGLAPKQQGLVESVDFQLQNQ